MLGILVLSLWKELLLIRFSGHSGTKKMYLLHYKETSNRGSLSTAVTFNQKPLQNGPLHFLVKLSYKSFLTTPVLSKSLLAQFNLYQRSYRRFFCVMREKNRKKNFYLILPVPHISESCIKIKIN